MGFKNTKKDKEKGIKHKITDQKLDQSEAIKILLKPKQSKIYAIWYNNITSD